MNTTAEYWASRKDRSKRDKLHALFPNKISPDSGWDGFQDHRYERWRMAKNYAGILNKKKDKRQRSNSKENNNLPASLKRRVGRKRGGGDLGIPEMFECLLQIHQKLGDKCGCSFWWWNIDFRWDALEYCPNRQLESWCLRKNVWHQKRRFGTLWVRRDEIKRCTKICK